MTWAKTLLPPIGLLRIPEAVGERLINLSCDTLIIQRQKLYKSRKDINLVKNRGLRTPEYVVSFIWLMWLIACESEFPGDVARD